MLGAILGLEAESSTVVGMVVDEVERSRKRHPPKKDFRRGGSYPPPEVRHG